MRTADFEFSLPEELIAQHPAPDRTDARLMIVRRDLATTEISRFSRLPELLRPGDLLVLNNSKVFPARLRGRKQPDGGQVEVLLLETEDSADSPRETRWWTLLRPAKRVRVGTRLVLGRDPGHLEVSVLQKNEQGQCLLGFPPETDVVAFAQREGEVPLPPYIRRPESLAGDRERYQTVYAREPGSVAAPTAGLHFSAAFLADLLTMGVLTTEVTLHVGIGTFAPVKVEEIAAHRMHAERYEVSGEAEAAVRRARRDRHRVIAVGTTSLRVLESVARAHGGEVVAETGRTRLFLHPPADFQVVDALLTNFHLPRSTLLMLVCAFAAPAAISGRDLVLRAYREAVAERFRFFSYGDAMLLL